MRPGGSRILAMVLCVGTVLPASADPGVPVDAATPQRSDTAVGLEFPAEATAVQGARAAPERWVFLVHGILLGKGSMAYLDERLSAAGFTVVNRSYPSTSLTIQESGEFLRRRIERRTEHNPDIEVNLVTHSMGGLIARYYLTHYPPRHFGALVQIAPPNHGSEKAERFKNVFFFRLMYRKPGQQLLMGLDAFQEELGYPTGNIGIIAGGTGDADGFSPAVPGDDDGTVSVQTTKLATMTDHIVLRYSHAFIMRKRETADQVIHFLNHGQFARPRTPPERKPTLVASD